jgi:outer membrane protein assembly factor BamB
MEEDEMKKPSTNAWRASESQDGESHADTMAQSRSSQRNSRRLNGSNRRLATGCLGGGVGLCVVLLLGCVLLSVAYPVEAQAVIRSLKGTFKSIGAQRPYQTDTLPTQMTLWQGRLYAPGPFESTSVFALDTGEQLSTFPGVVVGSDEQLLYVGLGRVSMSVHQDGSAFADAEARLPLIARDTRGAQVWTYATGAGDTGDQYNVNAWICQLQSSEDLIYVRLSRQILALEKTTGHVRWSYPYDSLGCSGEAQLVVTQQTLLLLDWNKGVALSASDGSRLDYQRWQGPSSARQIIADDDGQVIYVTDDVSDQDGPTTARRAATGAVLWQNSEPRPGPKYLLGVRDGVLYLLQDRPGQVVALSADTGRVLWSTKLLSTVPSQGTAFVGATQDVVYLAIDAIGNGSFFHGPTYLAFDTHTGAQRWSQSVPEVRSVSLLAGQSLYSAALQHRRQVTTGGFGGPRDVANCSDIVSMHHLSAASGGVVWQRTTSFPCTAHDNYF